MYYSKKELLINKRVILLIVLKIDMKLNRNLKVGYFFTKPTRKKIIYTYINTPNL